MKYFHKAWNKIEEIKWKLQYSNMKYRNLLILIKSASTSVDHFTNFMSYNNEFCLYLPILIMYIQKDMPFRNKKILCTLHYVFFFQIEEAISLLKKRKKKKCEVFAYLNKEDPIKIIVIVFVNCSLSTLIRTSVFFFNYRLYSHV